jgi:hypothetical protein
MKNDFDIDAVLSGPSRERFEEQKHIEMWFVATARIKRKQNHRKMSALRKSFKLARFV